MKPAADLFSGLGGFTEGARGLLDVQLVANHWDAAIEWHTANHPEPVALCQDLMQMDMRLLPDLRDGVLLAAPACQGHSQCGQPADKGTGGNYRPDPAKLKVKHQADRNTGWAVLAACDTARPLHVVVENVPDFLRWPLFPSWKRVIEDMGYHVQVHVLNALDFGSCQSRQRMVLTGSLVAPIKLTPHNGKSPGCIADCLDDDDSPVNRWTDIRSKSERMQSRMRRAQDQAGARCFWNNVSESLGRPLDGPFPTLTTKSGSQFCLLDGDRVRVLNPRELARAQSFPDTYQIPANRALAGKLIGNAIDVRMARSVIAEVIA